MRDTGPNCSAGCLGTNKSPFGIQVGGLYPGTAAQINQQSFGSLEIAQENFDHIRDLREVYIRKVESKKEQKVEFLEQPIDHETLAAYTKWKFPNLTVNAWLQGILLEDLDKTHFRTLSDIDSAVNRAADAIHSYAKENPGLFKAGTDYLTKSLGFADPNFREKHRFGARTRNAFTLYADRVGDHR